MSNTGFIYNIVFGNVGTPLGRAGQDGNIYPHRIGVEMMR